MHVLADQAFAAEFSAALSSGAIGWIITLACFAGIIVAVVPWGNLAPTWDPKKKPTDKPLKPLVPPVPPTPVKPVDDVTLTDKAKEFVVEREQSAAEKAALIEAKAKAMAEFDALIAANDADRRNAESLIIVGEATT